MSSTTELSELINSIAGKAVMAEADDIQALGDILQLVNEITDSRLQDYSRHIKSILERLILDEYEAPQKGVEDLHHAIEQLQMSFQDVEDKEIEQAESTLEAQRQVNAVNGETKASGASDETEQISSSEPKPAEIIMDEEEEDSDSNEATAQSDISEADSKSIDESNEDEDEDYFDAHAYFERRDDPKLIEETIKEDPELVQGFIDESLEQLTMIENGLISWEEAPTDLSIIDGIFRPFHTIKGVSGFLNLIDINAFAHLYEDLLDDARKGVIKHNQQISDTVFEGIDALKQMIDAINASKAEGKYISHGVDLEFFANRIQDARKGKHTSTDQESSADSTDQEGSSKSDKRGGLSGKKMKRSLVRTESSVKVSTLKMDALIDLVGELVVTQNMVVQNEEIQNSTDKRLQTDIGQLKRITGNLQDLSMSLRMVPIKETFQRMHRIVRDISRKSGKKIVLETRGEDTEIDRNMVEELYEPLVHMIRNNCDHGIELPEKRRKNGKAETGTVSLNAYYKGGMVVIELGDDGKGIDKDIIFNVAVKRDLAVETDKSKLSESEILNFIFSSGFSTSEKITDISGRGVGMDVVRKAITKLRGNIEVKTKVGKGTTFSLRLPLTLAIIDGVIVKVGSERYIIPTLSIKESLTAESGTFNKIVGKGETIFIRGRVIPLLRLNRVFGIQNSIEDPHEGLLIIVEADGQEAALLVDDMLDKQEIVIKSLGEGLNKIEGLAGGAILSDGNVGLIVDIPTLLPKSKKMRINAI